MNIGELFLNLGIKGTEKTVSAIGSVRKGMGEIASTSIEAKAAILGAMYGLERLVQMSNQMGTSLTNFNALTGISAQELQKWEFAARQAGISGQEVEGSLKGVQNAMTNMLLGKGAPEGLGLVAQKVGFDAARARDTLYVMQQLQKFAQAVPADIGNTVLKSFGLSEGTIAAMRRNAFRPDVMNRAPAYSDREIKALDKANIAWSNLSNKIQMAIGHFNALHGLQLVSDISKLTDKILQLASALAVLADKVKIFKVLGKAFEGWSQLIGVATKGAETVGGLANPKTHDKTASGISDFIDAIPGALKLMLQDFTSGKAGETIVNQTMNFFHDDGKDHNKAAQVHKKAIQGALRQFPAQGQGS